VLGATLAAVGIEAADWTFRSSMFRALRTTERGPEMSFVPEALEQEAGSWQSVCDAWRRLPPHPNILEITEVGEQLWLKYAPLAWRTRTLRTDAARAAIAATEVFQTVRKAVSAHDYRWFVNPIWFVDVHDQIRIGWMPLWKGSTKLAPELRALWPMVPERSMVFTVGQILAELQQESDLFAIVQRSTASKPDRRTSKLSELHATLRFAGAVGTAPSASVRDLIDEGIGWLETGHRAEAARRFDAAIALDPKSALAAQGLAYTRAVGLEDVGNAKRLESERWYPEAVDAYRCARHLMEPVEYFTALARCSLAVRRTDEALLYATRASELDPSNIEALEIEIDTRLRLGHLEDARRACQQLASVAPEKSVPALRKILEALFASDRSGAREPKVLLRAERAVCEQLLELAPAVGLEALNELAERAASSLPSSHALPICSRLYELSPTHGAKVFSRLAKRLAEHSHANLDDAVAICEQLYKHAPADGLLAFERVIEGVFQRGAFDTALGLADRLIALEPTSAAAHYRRGRCLFALKRLTEARPALEQACKLDPKLLEALNLRREVDRALSHVRAAVGTPHAQELAIPSHLPTVRDAMARGQIDEAVQLLEAHDPTDGAAQYLLGQLLVGKGRHVDAIVAFERVSGALVGAARVGKARALAAIGRGEEALRLLDRVVAEQPDLGEAYAVRTGVIHMLRAT
jgi:tetratricopeptide (TPR) repeat protein